MNKLNNTYIYTNGLSPRQLTELYRKYSEASGIEGDMEGCYFGGSWNFLFIIDNKLGFGDKRILNNSLRGITEKDLDDILKESSEYLPEVGEECEAVDYDCGNDDYYQKVIFIGGHPRDTSKGSFKAFSCFEGGDLFWSDKYRPIRSKEDIEREELYNVVLESFREVSGLAVDSVSLERLKNHSDLMYDKGVRLTTNKESV